MTAQLPLALSLLRYWLSRTTGCIEIHLVHVPGHVSISLNEIVDKNAKQAVRSALKPLLAYDEGWFRLKASSFLCSPPDYDLTPHTPTNLPVPTKASLSRLSARLATFIYQMIFTAGIPKNALIKIVGIEGVLTLKRGRKTWDQIKQSSRKISLFPWCNLKGNLRTQKRILEVRKDLFWTHSIKTSVKRLRGSKQSRVNFIRLPNLSFTR